MDNVLQEYYGSCKKIANKFIDRYFCEEDETHENIYFYAIADEYDAMWCVGESEYFMTLQEMVTCLKYNIPKEMFFDYYDDCVDGNMKHSLLSYYKMKHGIVNSYELQK